jgi:hypothetical protein
MDAGKAAWKLAGKEQNLVESLLDEMEAEDGIAEGLHEEVAQKLHESEEARDAVAGAILDLKRRTEACRAEKRRLDKRIASMERLCERVENQVMDTMKVGLKRLDGATASMTAVYRKNSKLEITDQEAVLSNPEFVRPPSPPEVDNSKVTEALEAGKYVRGARLKDTRSLRIK